MELVYVLLDIKYRKAVTCYDLFDSGNGYIKYLRKHYIRTTIYSMVTLLGIKYTKAVTYYDLFDSDTWHKIYTKAVTYYNLFDSDTWYKISTKQLRITIYLIVTLGIKYTKAVTYYDLFDSDTWCKVYENSNLLR